MVRAAGVGPGRAGLLLVLLLLLSSLLVPAAAAQTAPAPLPPGPRDGTWEEASALAEAFGEAGVIVEVRGPWPALAARDAEAEAVRTETRREVARVADVIRDLGGDRVRELDSEPWVIAFLDASELERLREADVAARLMLIPPGARVECPDQQCDLDPAPSLKERFLNPLDPTGPPTTSSILLAVVLSLLLLALLVALAFLLVRFLRRRRAAAAGAASGPVADEADDGSEEVLYEEDDFEDDGAAPRSSGR